MKTPERDVVTHLQVGRRRCPDDGTTQFRSNHMNTIEFLTVRTHAAMSRLTDLQRRAERIPGTPSAVVRTALKELGLALEQLQVANEQLSEQMNGLSAARQDVEGVRRRHREFINSLPLACLWTDDQGVVDEANEASAQLLNLSPARLPGKPLGLFITSRELFFETLASLRVRETLEVVVEVRPREQGPRKMRLLGQRLEHDTRICWLLRDVVAERPAP